MDRIIRQNFNYQTIENVHDTEFIDCPFTQEEKHTNPFINCSGLKFTRCRLKNCDVPEDSIIDDCFQCHYDTHAEEEELEFLNNNDISTSEIVEQIFETPEGSISHSI